MINKTLLQNRFSQNAKTYDHYAHVQKMMALRLLDYVKSIHQGYPLNILEIGCGTGYLTEKLVKEFPFSSITALDFSEGMLKVAKNRLSSAPVTFIHGDAETYRFTQKYDLILSNATFQWFTHPKQTIDRLIQELYQKGTLAFSTFGPRTFYELHHSFKEAKKGSQNSRNEAIGPTFLSLETYKDMFAPFSESLHVYQEEKTEYFPSVRDFLTSVKKIGATNCNPNQYVRPSVLKQTIRQYEANFTCEQGVAATYDCFYFIHSTSNPCA